MGPEWQKYEPGVWLTKAMIIEIILTDTLVGSTPGELHLSLVHIWPLSLMPLDESANTSSLVFLELEIETSSLAADDELNIDADHQHRSLQYRERRNTVSNLTTGTSPIPCNTYDQW